MGADVIKVERPVSGDWMRSMPMIGQFVGDDSAAFHAFNRNKRSIAIDLKHPEGRKALLEISKNCDVAVENFRTGVMDRLGLGYADFKEVNPKNHLRIGGRDGVPVAKWQRAVCRGKIFSFKP